MNRGNYTYKDGSKYDGEWKGNKRHGYGVWFRPDGMRYEGYWQDDKPNGQGTLTYPDGRMCNGDWKDGKFVKEALKEGVDKAHINSVREKKTYVFKDGTKYDGEWKDHKRHGYGVWIRSDGMKYEGEWEEDKPSGQGTLTYPNGEKRIGQWKDGKYLGEIKSSGNDTASTNLLNIDKQMVQYENNISKDQAAEGQEAINKVSITPSNENQNHQTEEAETGRTKHRQKKPIKWGLLAFTSLVLLLVMIILLVNLYTPSQRNIEALLTEQLNELLNMESHDSQEYQMVVELQTEAYNISEQVRSLIHSKTSFVIPEISKDSFTIEITSPKVDAIFEETLAKYEINYEISFNENRVLLLNNIYNHLKSNEIVYQTKTVELEYMESNEKVEVALNRDFYNVIYGGLLDLHEAKKTELLSEGDNLE